MRVEKRESHQLSFNSRASFEIKIFEKGAPLFSQVVDGAEIQALVSDSGIDLLNDASQRGRVEHMDTSEDNPPDQASDPAHSSRGSTAGELSRGRRRQRSTDGGAENENGNESDMDLELLAESESDSDEDGVPPGEDRARRLTTGGYDHSSNACVVSRCVLYSEDDSSSGDDDVVENEIDQVEDDDEMDEEGGERDENETSGARVLDVQRTGQSLSATSTPAVVSLLFHLSHM
jgi:hypothetical protein